MNWMIWSAWTLLELAMSTCIHMTYAVCIVVSALTANIFIWMKLSKSFKRKYKSSSELMKLEKMAAAAPSELLLFDLPPAVGEELIEEPDHKDQVQPPFNKDLTHSGRPGGHHHSYNLAPIILLHGIFGFGQGKLAGFSYFGGAEFKEDRVLVPDLGSLTSLHDRACELFYYLKGGTVDYGKEHSEQCGHSRYGRTYEKGHFPEWSHHHPVHFVGHSSGVQVARLLHTLMAENFFPDHKDTNEDWVASITALSGALNGTTRVYLDGLSPSDGKTIRPITLLQVLRIGVVLLEWLDIPGVNEFYSWGFQHFHLSWRKTGLRGLYDVIVGKTGPFSSHDWIIPDLSIQSTVELNKRLKTFPKTYYFSYATMKTWKLMDRTLPVTAGIHPLFYLRTLQMGQWCHPITSPLPYAGYRDEDWYDNDGALNTISMLYPRIPEEHPHVRMSDLKMNQTKYKSGVWYYTILDADHTTFILDPTRAGVHFDILYDSIFERCRKHLVHISKPSKVTTGRLCRCSTECQCSSVNDTFLGA